MHHDMDADRQIDGLGQILQLVVLLSQDMTDSLARSGLTVSRTRVLWELRHRGPSTQRTLADALNVSARTITGLVDGLVATGFVTRQPHPSDRRATLVTFTGHGTRTVEELERGQRELAGLLFDGMSERRFACFVAGLDAVLARLHDHGLAHTLRDDS
jgi:DNA-binding MarR family transcriptional regulator